jgi:hypothetical protein
MSGDHASLPLNWVDFDDTPMFLANQFLVQQSADEFILTVAQVTGPPTTDGAGATTDVEKLPVMTLGRFAFNRRRMVELVALLQAQLEDHDRRFGDRAP